MFNKLNDTIPWLGTVVVCIIVLTMVWLRQSQYLDAIETRLETTPSEVKVVAIESLDIGIEIRDEVRALREDLDKFHVVEENE